MTLIAKTVLKELAREFPPKCHYAFAYGSGVFAQKNQKAGKMIDLIFVVDDPIEWHRLNLRFNPHHYSGLRYLGPRFISFLQENMACGVYYNPYCEIKGRMMKYGVISISKLVRDLEHWDHMYIAGRLHKPVAELQPPGSKYLSSYLKHNRMLALRCALLQSEGITTKYQLFLNLAKLSYHGDTRMYFAEHPDKARNIVVPLMSEFDKIYMPLVKELDSAVELPDDIIAQDQSPVARYNHLIKLPKLIQRSLVNTQHKDTRHVDIEEVLLGVANSGDIENCISKAIGDVVRSASILQTVQGVLTAGPKKSIKYGWEKLQKRFKNKPEDPSKDDFPTTISMVVPASKVIKITKPIPRTGIKDAKITVTTVPEQSKSDQPPTTPVRIKVPRGEPKIIRPGSAIKQVSLLPVDPEGGNGDKSKKNFSIVTEHTIVKSIAGDKSAPMEITRDEIPK